jgi:hypothetical protein
MGSDPFDEMDSRPRLSCNTVLHFSLIIKGLQVLYFAADGFLEVKTIAFKH